MTPRERPRWLTPGTAEFAERERLFRWMMLDLEACVETKVRYHRLRIALLLRTLILDGAHSVAVNISSAYQMSLRFEVGPTFSEADQNSDSSFVPDFEQRSGGLDPYAIPGEKMAGTRVVTLDEFLAIELIRINGTAATVHDVVDNMAHFLGVAHALPPQTKVDELLTYNRWNIEIMGQPLIPSAIRTVGRVVHRTLLPVLNEFRIRHKLPLDEAPWRYA